MKMKKKLTKKKKKPKSKYTIKKPQIFSLNKFLIKLIIILFLIISYSYLYYIDKIQISLLKQYQSSIISEIISFEKNLNLTSEIFDEFRQINTENKLLEENINFKKSNNPDVSIIMTIYNQAHCIHKGIRSIQNQSLKNIEIILIDDCSLDNSTDVIKQYQKEDPRIILLNHDTNEGEIKSRTDGIRKAKGKYITIVDGDDALIHKDILKNCLFIAEKGKFDALEFPAGLYGGGKMWMKVYDYNKNIKINVDNIIYQPELKTKFVVTNDNINYVISNRLIWGKFIKREIFKKILTFIGTEYTDDYINEAEDTFMTISLFHLAKSYYIMKEFGYYYSKDEKIKDIPQTNNKICKTNNKLKNFGWYKYYKFLIEKKSDEEIEKKMIVNELTIKDSRKNLNSMNLDKRHYQILFFIYDKILEWKCLNQQQREYVVDLRNKLIERKNKDNIN